MKVLFIGDIVGKKARNASYELIKNYKNDKKADIIIVNVENSAGGFGVTPEISDSFLYSGADILTTGNHVWDKKEIIPYINKSTKLIRPLNMKKGTPGLGLTIVETQFGLIGVANIMTNLFMMPSDNMFDYVGVLINKLTVGNKLKFSLVDVHGEATSEKLALGYALDGYVTAVVGTHTHIPTADNRILEKGTAYISDVGMSGDYNSIIGMDKKGAISRFFKNGEKNHPRLEVSNGEPTICAVLIDVLNNGFASSIQTIKVGGILGD